MSRSEKTSRNLYIKGELSREFGGISQTPKTFFYQQKPKSIAHIWCRMSHQCTNYKTVGERLWLQMDWVRMDCNLKKVRLTVFKFLRCSLQEFS